MCAPARSLSCEPAGKGREVMRRQMFYAQGGMEAGEGVRGENCGNGSNALKLALIWIISFPSG